MNDFVLWYETDVTTGKTIETKHYLTPEEIKERDDDIVIQARLKRNKLLSELDMIICNPLRWASFSQAQQQAWADYRQALLDVPQQNGFPNIVDFPVKPSL